MPQLRPKREIIVRVTSSQRERLQEFYRERLEDRRLLARALELPDSHAIRLKLSPVQLLDLLSDVEDDYEQSRGDNGNRGLLLRHGLFALRNTLALAERYGITGDE